jgi:HEXXH motif-containing protein
MSAPGGIARDGFRPSADNGLRARAAIHARLQESLRHIFQQCSGHLAVDQRRADALVLRIASGERLPPALFGHYFFLVDRIENGSLEQVQAALDTLLCHAEGALAPALRIRPLNRQSFSAAEETELRRQFVSESLRDEQIAHLPEHCEQATRARLQRALAILQQHAPATYAEIESTICEIVPVHGNVISGMSFGGGSSLERWGTMLVNAKIPSTDLGLSETITHECAHNALFAMAPVNFHVENDAEALYRSPLRVDRRPMNGIYHASFVLARMCYAMREVMMSPSASVALREEAEQLAQASAKLFADGYEVLKQHARYTTEGRAIMQGAARYMGSVAS